MDLEIVRLLHNDGTWEAFKQDWEAQCAFYDEDFGSYAEGTFSVVGDLVQQEGAAAGLFAVKVDGRHVSMCQLNRANIPGYTGPVLRVRYMTLSPDYDFGDKPVEDYADILIKTFATVLAVSNKLMKADHIKFHLRSPADRQFFAALGRGMDETDMFHSVQVRGAWLYVTKS
ncbi:conserved hypothetical protein [Agrobacterium fabacearum CFBP 5771]|uniref:hypothetical protein n=1 Tax=Agrobacterium tumefaciens TaxID=358 RepID=UPI0009BC666F|nr:hypothetical protein [Agrobacterium tumefaciens]CVI22769.1 conserved hypothetical protein [Agrobacterium fabacearum CFBP 5771]